MTRQRNKSQGQALVEFALIITVLLMLMFLIVESARILQGWVTVQNAARAGARYAITGGNMSTCPTLGSAKWSGKCGDLRLASIITNTHEGLAGLPLNEAGNSNAYRDVNGNPPDPNSYDIQVWGGSVGQAGSVLQADFGGMPGQPVIVRAIYNVPIITPFFNSIIESVPVFGQVTMNNENFGSLGNPTQGLGLPPGLAVVPTVGATPTPSPSPTPTFTSTPGDTATPTATASNTPSPTPTYCGAFFEAAPVEGQDYVWVSGEVGDTVRIIDLTTGQTLGTDTFLTASGHNCPGFADFNTVPLVTTLVAGHVILAVPTMGNPATAFVLQGTPTPTPSPTTAPTLTPTPSETPTITPTPTPSNAYIRLIPNCSIGSSAQFNVLGVNWPTNEAVALFWNGLQQSVVPSGHPGSFSQTWQKTNLTVGTPGNPTIYTVRAQSNSFVATADFEVPCANVTPTIVATATPTPNPADLIVVGPPQIISTRPLVAYKPIDVRVVISNTGQIDVNSQFFVDVYFDPLGTVSPTIAITNSVGYMAVSSLAGGASRVISITAPLGFKNLPTNHLVYGMVDSLEAAIESDETNNVSTPLAVNDVTPDNTPTPSPTPPVGGAAISGIVRIRIGSWVPQNRAVVALIDEGTSTIIGSTLTNRNGYYQFTNIPATNYTVKACFTVDSVVYSGLRIGITAPDPFANVYMLAGPCP